ncbi:hypothetical protein [Streptomyces sp. NBC_00057]|uniref:hypothetical protein n=1 Tax=Streptomyces sp. NBC_00057 TaxID=2975634 RepID=UPI00325593A9
MRLPDPGSVPHHAEPVRRRVQQGGVGQAGQAQRGRPRQGGVSGWPTAHSRTAAAGRSRRWRHHATSTSRPATSSLPAGASRSGGQVARRGQRRAAYGAAPGDLRGRVGAVGTAGEVGMAPGGGAPAGERRRIRVQDDESGGDPALSRVAQQRPFPDVDGQVALRPYPRRAVAEALRWARS